jgi:SAM-dependent methyltransferase
MFNQAMADNLTDLAAQARTVGGAGALRVLDLGCWDGATTVVYLPPGATGFGIEVSGAAARVAAGRGLRVVRGDLDRGLPLRSASFDLVTSNQVFEHVADTDQFMAEAHRVLRPGGRLLVSTENLASWHNIAALTLGWQAFSLTNVSRYRPGVGNPLANLRHAEPLDAGWQHLRIFSYRGLKELAEAVGFVDVTVTAAGYYPLPRRLARRDPRHGAFITVSGRRPADSR